MTAIKSTSLGKTSTPIKHHPYARSQSTASPVLTAMTLPDLANEEKKHITISLSDPTLTRYGDAIYDPAFLAIALDPSVSEKEKLKAARGVRNRLSAACSRQKRKELLDGLKDDNERLRGENQVLMEEVKRLRSGAPPTTTTTATTGRDMEEPLKVVSPAPQPAALPSGTIDPTSLSSSAPPSQSAHLILIGELITTNQSLQGTITSLVADRDSWKLKYESLMANITRLGADKSPVGAVASDAMDETYVTSPTKSTTSTLVSEYLLDAVSSPSADISMDEPFTAESSSPSTPAAARLGHTMSPRLSILSQLNTCHPAAVATLPLLHVIKALFVGFRKSTTLT
jgi:cell division protein FtsB